MQAPAVTGASRRTSVSVNLMAAAASSEAEGKQKRLRNLSNQLIRLPRSADVAAT